MLHAVVSAHGHSRFVAIAVNSLFTTAESFAYGITSVHILCLNYAPALALARP